MSAKNANLSVVGPMCQGVNYGDSVGQWPRAVKSESRPTAVGLALIPLSVLNLGDLG